MHKFALHRSSCGIPEASDKKESDRICESGAFPMLRERVPTHEAKGHMRLDHPEELRAAEYKATANLVWIADTGASHDMVPEGLAQVLAGRRPRSPSRSR